MLRPVSEVLSHPELLTAIFAFVSDEDQLAWAMTPTGFARSRREFFRIGRIGGNDGRDRIPTTLRGVVSSAKRLRWALSAGLHHVDSLQLAVAIARHGSGDAIRLISTLPARVSYLSPPFAHGVMEAAAVHGNKAVLGFLRQRGHDLSGNKLVEMCARGGSTMMVQWALSKGGRLSPAAFAAAAGSGSSELVRWLVNKGCHWDWDSAEAAARGGHVHVLQYLDQTFRATMGGGWEEELRELVMGVAAEWGQREVISWAIASGWEVGDAFCVCARAAAGGDQRMLAFCRTMGFPWDETTCQAAASSCSLEILRWAREQGAPWDSRAACEAAAAGSLEVLQWLRTGTEPDQVLDTAAAPDVPWPVGPRPGFEPCPWDEDTTAEASMGGHADVLEWAVRGGCPVDGRVISNAAMEGHLRILEMVRSGSLGGLLQERFSGREVIEFAAMGGCYEIVRWVWEIGEAGSFGGGVRLAVAHGHHDLGLWMCARGAREDL